MLEAVTQVEAEASCIALHHPAENPLRIEFPSGEAAEGVKQLAPAMGQGILGHVASAGKALRVDDVRQDPRFEPFVTSGKEHGTGLGLAIVPGIVEGHGGSIQVDSRVAGEEAGRGSGSVFTIRMPAHGPTEC